MLDLYADFIQQLKLPLKEYFEAQGLNIEDFPLAPPTREDAGDLSLPCHSYAKVLKKAPQQIALALAEKLQSQALVKEAQAVNGFLNFSLNWEQISPILLNWALTDETAIGKSNVLAGRKIVIEYSAPNTNNPNILGIVETTCLGQQWRS